MNHANTLKSENAGLSKRVKGALLFLSLDNWLKKSLSKVIKLTNLIGNAVALGLLNVNRINELVRHTYTSQPDYYNPDRYDHKWEEQIIEPLREKTSNTDLLVAFCGKGRESEIFARNGFSVTGIDREAFMIEDAIANTKNKKFEAKFECADFNHYSSSSPYSIVYTSTWMYTTYPSKEGRQAFLNKCRELCNPEGTIVISYRTRPNNFKDSLVHLITKVIGFITAGNRKTEKGDRLENGLFWHYFTESEIEAEIEEARMKTSFHKPSENGYLEWRFLIPIHEKQPNSNG